MDHLNAAIIGLGIGARHISAFKSHPCCDLIAVCDFEQPKLDEVGKKYPDINLTRNDDEILSNPDIDIVSIATYDNFHAEQVLKALKHNKHVFVEKPICLNHSEAVSIRNVLKSKNGICLSSNLNLRTCPRFIHLKSAIQSGEMGRIFYLEGDYLWGRIDKLTDGWRKNMEFYSIVYGAAVHMIDLILWITNDKPIEVTGYGNRIATENSDFRYNDFAVVFLKFGNGMVAKVSGIAGCIHPHFHKISVFGTEKTFFHDISGGMFLTSQNLNSEKQFVTEEYPSAKEKGKIISTFIDSIIDSQSMPIVSSEDVFSTMSICFAAEKAISEGQAVEVKYIE